MKRGRSKTETKKADPKLSVKKGGATAGKKPTTISKNQNEADLEEIAVQAHKQFSFQTLSKATNNFHPDQKLGEGGFGPVFKGKLADGRVIAVKKLSQRSSQGNKEFENEANLLVLVQHRNVMNLLGHCVKGEEKLLVYEYVANESLDKLLIIFCKFYFSIC